MRSFAFAALAGAIFAGAFPAKAKPWYYCESASAYYPYVQRCATPWRIVRPHRIQQFEALPQQPSIQQEPTQSAQPQQDDAAAQAKAQAEARAEAEVQQQHAIKKAISRGYKLVTSAKDILLDGKDLANSNAKIQISGYYRKSGDNGILYGSFFDDVENTDNYIPLITEDAQRALREYLLSPSCAQQFGCKVDVGGHMTMCKHLAAGMADYPPMPCLNVEVEIVYRPGD